MKKIRDSKTVAKTTAGGTNRRCTGSAARNLAARTFKGLLAVGVLLMFITIVQADYVGTLTNRIFIDPERMADILDGYDVGDEIGFIFETTPAPNGDRGIAAWSTIYVPAGVVVIGAELVQEDGDGTYSSIPAKDVAAARDDCGARGCVFPTTGTLQNGLLNEVQQDTGVFYSTDAQTALLGAPLSLSPTGTDVTPQNVYNQWDFNQTTAFGIGGALSGNAGKGNTPVVDVANDGVFVGTGSPIAGSGSYYQNDYDPSCNVSAIFEDDIACQGPWQRIRYDSAKIGGSGAIVPATTSATEPLLNTAVATTAGHDFAADGQLPSSTNTVRYVQGIRRIGDLELGRIIFRITDPAAFTASFTAGSGSEDTFCLDATGGDLDKGDFTDPTRRGAQDNPWRYYEGNAHECFEGSVDGALVKRGEFVNGDPNLGISLQNDVVGYAITFFNTTNATLFDVDLSDAVLENLALVDFTDANCPYTSYDGDQGGLPTLATRTATTATWNRLDTLAAGDSVTVHMCAVVTSGTVGDQVRNEAQVDFATVDAGPQQSVTSETLAVIATRITGTVFSDDDSDSAFSAGDGTIAGVTMELYDGAVLLATTVTNPVGFYQFVGHPAGTYTVVAIDLPGYSSIRDIDTAPPCAGNNCNEVAITLVNRSVDNDFLDDATGNAIQGTVFVDLNIDATRDLPEDVGQSAVTVRLYDDVNGNGVVDGPDTLITTTVTASDGSYSFDLTGASALGDFVLEIDTATLPANSTLTTDNVESASFVDFGNTDTDNDFGFIGPTTLAVTKTSGAVGAVMAGDNIVYTIRPSHVGTDLLTNVEASDAIPANTSFVSATPAQDSGPDPVVWELGSNTAGTVGTTASGSCAAFAASLDTFIEEKNPTTNHGGENELKNKNKAADSKRSLVEWDLSCLPANALVTSATMSFYVTKEKNTSVQIYRMTQDWTEGGATWNTHDGTNTWTTAGGDFNPTAEGTFNPTTKNVYENVTVTSLVQSWASGTANEGVILLSTTQDEAKLGTRENGGKEPLLAISYGHTTTLTASSLVTDGDVITVTMTLDSSTSDTNVTPGTLNVTGDGNGRRRRRLWQPHPGEPVDHRRHADQLHLELYRERRRDRRQRYF